MEYETENIWHFGAKQISNESQNDSITRSGWNYRVYEEFVKLQETFFLHVY